ncbi:MAG: hypothetical protein SGJ26_18475 [Nitrospirota bacterium]|nr:hypothetical protein [Nitrospirota bacterium]
MLDLYHPRENEWLFPCDPSRVDGENSLDRANSMGEANEYKNLLYSLTSIILLERLIYEGFFARFGGVGDMRPDGIRKWEGDTWSL